MPPQAITLTNVIHLLCTRTVGRDGDIRVQGSACAQAAGPVTQVRGAVSCPACIAAMQGC